MRNKGRTKLGYTQVCAKGAITRKGKSVRKVLLCMLCILASSCEPPPAYNDFHAIELLARQGDAMAQYRLGLMYDIGENVEKNNSESVKWYFRSAEQGNVKSQHMLGEMYYTGSGVQQSYFHSFVWLSIAEIGGETSSSVRDTSAKALSPTDLEAAEDYIAKLIEAIEAAKTVRG